MTNQELRRRRGGPIAVVGIDVILHAVRHRSWLLVLLIVCAALAVVLAVVGQATLPYLIYPAL